MNELIKQLLGIGETAASLGSSMWGIPLAGYRGLYGLATGETPKQASQAQNRVLGATTYQPRTQLGQQYTQNVGDVLNYVPQAAGNFVYDVTGSPLLGAGAEATTAVFGPSMIARAARGRAPKSTAKEQPVQVQQQPGVGFPEGVSVDQLKQMGIPQSVGGPPGISQMIPLRDSSGNVISQYGTREQPKPFDPAAISKTHLTAALREGPYEFNVQLPDGWKETVSGSGQRGTNRTTTYNKTFPDNTKFKIEQEINKVDDYNPRSGTYEISNEKTGEYKYYSLKDDKITFTNKKGWEGSMDLNENPIIYVTANEIDGKKNVQLEYNSSGDLMWYKFEKNGEKFSADNWSSEDVKQFETSPIELPEIKIMPDDSYGVTPPNWTQSMMRNIPEGVEWWLRDNVD